MLIFLKNNNLKKLILLQTENISNVTIHSSTTEWKSNFKIEIFGSEGSLIIDGRSKSYGPQSISFCKKWFWLDEKDKSKTWKYDLDDDSFRMELKSFIGLVSSGENDGIIAGPEDGLKSIKIIEGLYNNPEMLISFG